MPAPWTSTVASSASGQGVLSILAPGNGLVPRVQEFSASLTGATSGAAVLQILDGSTGTVLFQLGASIASGAQNLTIVMGGLDYRASGTNTLVIGFSTAIAGLTQRVNAIGDFVQVGTDAFARGVKS